MDHPLRPVVSNWIEKIRLAANHKREKFQRDADEAMQFFDGPYNFMYGLKYSNAPNGMVLNRPDDGGGPYPSFCMTVNKVAECVQIFGPVLYHRNPTRQVNPRKVASLPLELFGNPQDPNLQQMVMPMLTQIQQQKGMDEARAKLLEQYLNYTPSALDLKTESRFALNETLIKGMGILWTETYVPPGSQTKMIGSFYDTIDNLFIDPDAERISEAKWIARRRIMPKWEVEERFQLPPDTLKGGLESFKQQSDVNTYRDGEYSRRKGHTNDLCIYYEIYSKMGLGGKMSGIVPGLEQILSRYGTFKYLAITEELPYPLNLPPQMIETADDNLINYQTEWHTPFWADDSWPFSYLAFHPKPRELWPVSHIKPAMGELKFLNWAYSFIAGKIRNTCRDFVLVKKSLAEEVKNKILNGTDLELIEIEHQHTKTMSEVVSYLQHPQMNGDIFAVIQAVENNFEKRVGLTELMYGESARQMRSASEAQVKADQLHVRPDDMANKVEDWMGDVARKEAIAARVHLSSQDVFPVLGQFGAQYWDQIVRVAEINQIVHELEYRIESGSARKPNKERDAANAQEAMKTLFQPMFQVGMQLGNVQPVNAIITMWCKSMDMDPAPFLLQPPPPPMPMPGQGGGPPQPGGQAA